jgi:pimeloyl-ACP methyl ester carboxylesterase
MAIGRHSPNLLPVLGLSAAIVTAACTSEPAPTRGPASPPASTNPAASNSPATSVGSITTEAADTTTSNTAPSVDEPAVSSVSDVPCWWGAASSSRVRCHELTTTNVGVVALAVLEGSDRAAPPLLYLSGGPGFPTLDGVEEWLDDLDRFGGRSVILLDQPGTGWSTPSLDCPERDAAIRRSYDVAAPFAVERDALRTAIADCRTRLDDSGVDLTGYASASIAGVIDEARRAMGFESWHVIGTSYGTLLAMEVAVAGGDAVASLILDGVYPPERTGATTFVERTVEGTRRVLAACAADPGCDDAHPGLDDRLWRMIDDLDDTPILTDVLTDTGDTVSVEFTGADALATLYFAAWSRSTMPSLPLLVEAFERRDAAIVASVAAAGLDELGELVEGTHYAIECSDRGAVVRDDDLDTALADMPAAGSALLAIHSFLTICDHWEGDSTPLRSVESYDRWPTPTLILTGELDPVTPVEWGTELAERLDAQHIVIPGGAHVNWAADDCVLGIVLDVVEDPSAEPDASCLASRPAVAWAGL